MIDDFLSRLQDTGSEEERRWLALEFNLNSLSPGLREAIWAAAIPHWFDGSLLAALLGEEGFMRLQAAGGLDALARLPFIEPFPNRGFNVHERTRVILRAQLWKGERDRFIELSGRAEEYSRGQDPEDTSWTIERIYHLLLTDPDQGADQLQETGWRWQNSPNFAYDKVEAMARIARELIDEGMLNGRGKAWAIYWEGHLDVRYYRNRSALEKLSQIDLPSEIDPFLKAVKLNRLGDVELREANYAAARALYEEARPVYAAIGDRLGEANTIKALGELEGDLEHESVALELLNQAAAAYHDLGLPSPEAGCYNLMASIVEKPGREEEALVFYNRALAINPVAMWFRNRASTLITLQRFDEAERDLDQAESLQPEQPYAYLRRAQIALWRKEPQIAAQLTERAIELRPSVSDFHAYLAFAHLADGQTVDAITHFKKAMALTYRPKEFTQTLEELAKLEQAYGSLSGLDEMRRLVEEAQRRLK